MLPILVFMVFALVVAGSVLYVTRQREESDRAEDRRRRWRRDRDG